MDLFCAVPTCLEDLRQMKNSRYLKNSGQAVELECGYPPEQFTGVHTCCFVTKVSKLSELIYAKLVF